LRYVYLRAPVWLRLRLVFELVTRYVLPLHFWFPTFWIVALHFPVVYTLHFCPVCLGLRLRSTRTRLLLRYVVHRVYPHFYIRLVVTFGCTRFCARFTRLHARLRCLGWRTHTRSFTPRGFLTHYLGCRLRCLPVYYVARCRFTVATRCTLHVWITGSVLVYTGLRLRLHAACLYLTSCCHRFVTRLHHGWITDYGLRSGSWFCLYVHAVYTLLPVTLPFTVMCRYILPYGYLGWLVVVRYVVPLDVAFGCVTRCPVLPVRSCARLLLVYGYLRLVHTHVRCCTLRFYGIYTVTRTHGYARLRWLRFSPRLRGWLLTHRLRTVLRSPVTRGLLPLHTRLLWLPSFTFACSCRCCTFGYGCGCYGCAPLRLGLVTLDTLVCLYAFTAHSTVAARLRLHGWFAVYTAVTVTPHFTFTAFFTRFTTRWVPLRTHGWVTFTCGLRCGYFTRCHVYRLLRLFTPDFWFVPRGSLPTPFPFAGWFRSPHPVHGSPPRVTFPDCGCGYVLRWTVYWLAMRCAVTLRLCTVHTRTRWFIPPATQRGVRLTHRCGLRVYPFPPRRLLPLPPATIALPHLRLLLHLPRTPAVPFVCWDTTAYRLPRTPYAVLRARVALLRIFARRRRRNQKKEGEGGRQRRGEAGRPADDGTVSYRIYLHDAFILRRNSGRDILHYDSALTCTTPKRFAFLRTHVAHARASG